MMARGPAFYIVVVAAFAAAIAAVALSTRRAGSSPACMTLDEARARGQGYPRWTYEHRRAGDRRCWYVSAQQLQALRARPRNELKPPRDQRTPVPPPREKEAPREQLKAEDDKVPDVHRFREAFGEIADMITMAPPLRRPAEEDDRPGPATIMQTTAPRPGTTTATIEHRDEMGRGSVVGVLGAAGASLALALLLVRLARSRTAMRRLD